MRQGSRILYPLRMTFDCACLLNPFFAKGSVPAGSWGPDGSYFEPGKSQHLNMQISLEQKSCQPA